MKNKTVIIAVVAVIVGALLFSGGLLVGKMLEKSDTKCKVNEEERTNEKKVNAKKIEVYTIDRLSDYGAIEEADTDLLDREGFIVDESYNIEEIKDVKMKGHIEIPPTDVGGSDYFFLSEDNRMFVFSAICDTFDPEEYDVNDCVSPIKTPHKVDSIKYYEPADYEFSRPILLYYSGNDIYDIDWNKVDINKRIIYIFEYFSADINHFLYVGDREEGERIEIDGKPLKGKYIFITLSDDDENTIFYIASEDDVLYKLEIDDVGDYEIKKIDKIKEYDFNSETDLDDEDSEFYCSEDICDFIVELDNGENYNFVW